VRRWWSDQQRGLRECKDHVLLDKLISEPAFHEIEMSIYRSKKLGLGFSMSLALLTGYTTNSQAETFECTADVNTVSHNMSVTVEDGSVSKFEYVASTPVSDDTNDCSVSSNRVQMTQKKDGEQTYVLPRTHETLTTVKKVDNQYIFSFSKKALLFYCGQSSTIAQHLTITPGSKHCSDIENF
jgi:hypothetical protein